MPVKNNRTEWIKARVTPIERVHAEHTAAILNLTMSDLIRALVLEGRSDAVGLNADDRNSLNLILRYLQQIHGGPVSGEVMTAVLNQLSSLIQRIDALQ